MHEDVWLREAGRKYVSCHQCFPMSSAGIIECTHLCSHARGAEDDLIVGIGLYEPSGHQQR